MSKTYMPVYKYIVSLINLSDYGYSHITEVRAMISKIKEIFEEEVGGKWKGEDERGGEKTSVQAKVAYWLSSQSLAINAPHPDDVTVELIHSLGLDYLIRKDGGFNNDDFYRNLAGKLTHMFNSIELASKGINAIFRELDESVDVFKHECPDCGTSYTVTSHNNFNCPNCEDYYNND